MQSHREAVPDESTQPERNMFDKYQEHLRDSIPDNSRFDGFDRGDAEPILPASAYDDEWEDIEF